MTWQPHKAVGAGRRMREMTQADLAKALSRETMLALDYLGDTEIPRP